MLTVLIVSAVPAAVVAVVAARDGKRALGGLIQEC
jgi:hypothetical protein